MSNLGQKRCLQLPEDTAKAIPDGWFRTGDLARQGDDGYWFILDQAAYKVPQSVAR